MIVEAQGVETFVAERASEQGHEATTSLPTVLLLHGNPDSSKLWQGVIDRLPEYRCVAPDLPGFGLSRADPEYSERLGDRPLGTMADWLDGVVDRVIPEGPIHLVVHDFGGPYGLAWALRRSDRIASITAIDTLFFADYRWHFWARVWRTPWLGELSIYLFSWPIFRWEMRRGSPSLTDTQLREVWAGVTTTMKRMVLTLYRATDSAIFKGHQERLQELLRSVPSLAIWGENDPYIGPEWAYRLGADEVQILEGCGHWTPLEAPDQVVERLRALFAGAVSVPLPFRCQVDVQPVPG